MVARIGGADLIHVGYWAHARRKFVNAVKLNPDDAEAVNMVTRMDALFLVDRDARQKNMTADQRLASRREHAFPWANEIHAECKKLRAHVLPKSALGQAVNYTLNQWTRLRRCLDHAEIELSHSLAENSMRPIALGRKNWLHVGSPQSGPKVAAILSVFESCPQIGCARARLSPRRPPRHGPTQALRNPQPHPSLLDLTLTLGWSDAYIFSASSVGWGGGVLVLRLLLAVRLRRVWPR